MIAIFRRIRFVEPLRRSDGWGRCANRCPEATPQGRIPVAVRRQGEFFVFIAHTIFPLLEEQSTGKVVFRIEWSNTVCGACPLRPQCVSAGQDHRTFVVGELHSLLQERRREMQTDAFKKEMHRRNGIEGTQSELVREHGYHTAYFGKWHCGTVHNQVPAEIVGHPA